jgi:hypothetical protein
MSKTPEQMAEEYAKIVWDDSDLAPEDRAVERHVVIGAIGAKMGFLAGYQAAKDQVADVSKVMPQWVSIKDRLPEEGAVVLLADIDDSYNRISIGYRTFPPFDGPSWHVPGKAFLPEHFYTHWQPLPKPPEE